jgi:Uma2 family endonuclease
MSMQTLMTVEQFAQLETAETEDFELVDGELIPLSSGTFGHSRTRDRIVIRFGSYLASHPVGEAVGEIDCRLSASTVRRPDVAFFFTHAVGRMVPENEVPIPFPPDIAIEVLSPSESAIDVNRKVRDYLDAGAKEVWVFDHYNAEAFVYSRTGLRMLLRNDVLETPLLEGFTLPLAELFQQTADTETRSNP